MSEAQTRKSEKKAPDSSPAITTSQKNAEKLAAQKKREAEQQAARAKRMAKSASVVARSSPVYPRSARRKKIQGRVIITVTIGINGQVIAGAVSQSSSDPSLDQAALNAARKYRFKAAINGLGQAMTSSKRIPFDFRLKQ